MTILRRAAPTRWLYPAILLLLFMEKSSALEIAGYGGSASWTQIGATFESDGSDAPGSILSFSQDGSRLLRVAARVGTVMTSPCTNGNPVRAPGHRSVISPKTWQPSHPSASLSGDGNVVALGDGDDYSGSESVWTARVFHYSGGSWQQVGSDIVGPLTEGAVMLRCRYRVMARCCRSGTVHLNHPTYNATQTGRVRIYQWPSNDLAAADTWTQMGETIEAWKTDEGDGSEMEPYKACLYGCGYAVRRRHPRCRVP